MNTHGWKERPKPKNLQEDFSLDAWIGVIFGAELLLELELPNSKAEHIVRDILNMLSAYKSNKITVVLPVELLFSRHQEEESDDNIDQPLTQKWKLFKREEKVDIIATQAKYKGETSNEKKEKLKSRVKIEAQEEKEKEMKEKEMKEKEMKEKEMKAILQVQLEDEIQEMEENEESTRRSARSNKGKYWYGKYKE